MAAYSGLRWRLCGLSATNVVWLRT